MAIRKRKILYWAAAVVGFLALFVALAGWWLAGTQSGTRWAFTNLADRLFEGSFEVGESHGPLGGPLRLEDVVYETDTVRVEIERLAIDWTLSGLLRERLVVHELVADGVTVIRKGAAERKDDPLPDVTLPVDVFVEDAVVRRIRIVRGDEEPVVIDEIALASSLEGELVTVERLAIRSPLFNVDLVGEVRPQGAYPVDLEVDWETTAGDVRWAGSGKVRGTLESLAIDQRLSSPAAAHVVATLDEPLLDLAFDGTVDAEPFDPAVLGLELPIEVTRVSGRLTAVGELEVFRTAGDLRLETPEYGPLMADVALVRDHDRLTIERLVATRPGGGALRVEATGDVGWGGAATRFDLDLAWRGLPYPFQGEPFLRSREGSGRVAGTAADYTVEADAQVALAGEQIPEGRWSLLMRGGGERLLVRRLRGRVGEGEVTASGSVVPGEVPRFDLDVAWSDLAYPFRGEPTITSSAGSGEIRGTLADYDVEVDALVRGPRLGEGRLVLRGSGDRESLDLASARTDLLGGEVTAAGRVTWSPAVSWSLELAGSSLEPELWREDLYGELDVVAASEGRMTDDGPVGTLAPFRVQGTLRGAPLVAAGDLRFAGGVTRVADLEATWGGARLVAAGSLGEIWDLDFEAEVPDLALVADGAAGELAAAGRLSGTGPLPSVTAEVAGEALVWEELRIGTLAGEVDLDLREGGAMVADLEARDVVFGEQRLERVAVESAGTVDAHVVQAVAAMPRDEGVGGVHRVELAGGFDLEARRWRGELRDASVEAPRFGRWQLESPAALAASAEAVSVERFCLARDEASLCLGGRWRDAAGWRVLGGLVDVPLDLVDPFLPATVDVTGTVDGIVRLRGDAAGLAAADVDLRPGPGALVVPVDGEETRFAFERGLARLFTTEEGLAARVELTFPELGDLAADLLLPGFTALALPPEDQPLTGEVVADIDDLAFLAAFTPRFTDVAGRLDARFRLAGTLGAPRPEGEIVLAGGAVDVREYGIELREIELTARSSGEQAFTLDGSVRSGEGTLQIGGRLSLVPTPESPVRLELRGERFEAVDRADLRVLASPDVTATFDGTLLDVRGEILVPEATVEYTRREGVIQPSRDVVVVGGETERESVRDLDLVARLRLTLGEDVHVEALGLEGDVEGSLVVTDEPSKPVQATGELRIVEGTYTSYGQDLEIERGRLFFAGGTLDDPGIDLRASRRAEGGVVAGIEVGGRLQAPVVEVWSEPDMAETDALAYLLLGRPLATAGENDTSLLARAASGLGLGGGNLLVQRLGESAGLEDVRIETDGDIEEAAFVVGKYLSPGLYVAYGIGLFDPVSTFRIRYTLSSKWSLEAEVGDETTADVYYSIESGE